MSSSDEYTEESTAVLQKFEYKHHALPSLPTHLCPETGELYILWSDIQDNIVGASHLQTYAGRAMFMIDKHGELHQPLRIKHSEIPYTVYRSSLHRIRIEESQKVKGLGGSSSSLHDPLLTQGQLSIPLKHLIDKCQYLIEHLETTANGDRFTFRQTIANAQYYHSMATKRLEILDQDRVRALVDGKDRASLLRQLRELEQQMSIWEYRNTCRSMSQGKICRREYTTSSLFIVLPSNLRSWDDSDPKTHQFRLYFLCDIRKAESAPKDSPQYVHLSNHPGYTLDQPLEFLQTYGDYVLKMLRMIKHGYSDDIYEIPPLKSLKILWNCDPHVFGKHLTQKTIQSLVDKAILYLIQLAPPKSIMEPGLTRHQSAAIKVYLQEGGAVADLHRYINHSQDVFWMCQHHKRQSFGHGSRLAQLKYFVRDHGGNLDMQQATLKVEVGSPIDVDRLRTLLASTNHIFDLSIKLNWKPTRRYLRQLCLDLAKTKTITLEIDGITPDIYPQDSLQCSKDIFADSIIPETKLPFITLLNYPRPQEQCIHMGQFSIQSAIPPPKSCHSWMELRSGLETFGGQLSKVQVAADCTRVVSNMRAAVRKYGLPEKTLVTFYKDTWKVVVDLQKGTFVEVYSQDLSCPKSLLSLSTIQKLTVDRTVAEFDRELGRIIQANKDMSELHISTKGRNVLYEAERIARLRRNALRPLCLTLFDRIKGYRGRMVAEVDIGGGSFIAHATEHDPVEPELLRWDCKLSDHIASFLDATSQQHPAVLVSFTVDISCLTADGLISVQNVLRRSNLDHLHILCNPIAPDMCDPIAQVLSSVQWPTLKSLVLSGACIEDWLQLWRLTSAPQLLSLRVQGTESVLQELSHSSVLWIYRLVFGAPLVDLAFEYVLFQDKNDWGLIVDSLDMEALESFDLCETGQSQLMSCSIANQIFRAKYS
ncbi:hypothetical protein BGZ93_009208 [Podila epicladia]|nr:hypothetical protein BGZ92_011440 [Podila epicladia]KAG0090661.1 hypothetical protein BGZ93_009208 [Podila epicladia]